MSSYLDTGPATRAVAITPDDGEDLAITRAIWIGGAGDLSLIMVDESTPVTFVGIQAGTLLPFRARRVRATGTTATNIIGLY